MSFVFGRGGGLERTQQASWSAFLPLQLSRHKKLDCILVDIFAFWWNVAFHWWRGPVREPRAGGRERRLSEWWPLAALHVPRAQRASCHLAAMLLMSCRARDSVSHTLWGFFWYTLITFTDLPCTQIKMKFALTAERRSERKAEVFVFVFPFGCYFSFPLLPVLMQHCKHFRKLICRSTAHKRSSCRRMRLCLLQKRFRDSHS